MAIDELINLTLDPMHRQILVGTAGLIVGIPKGIINSYQTINTPIIENNDLEKNEKNDDGTIYSGFENINIGPEDETIQMPIINDIPRKNSFIESTKENAYPLLCLTGIIGLDLSFAKYSETILENMPIEATASITSGTLGYILGEKVGNGVLCGYGLIKFAWNLGTQIDKDPNW